MGSPRRRGQARALATRGAKRGAGAARSVEPGRSLIVRTCTVPTLTPLANHAPRSAGTADTLRICHVMTADLWAGAETQVATIASYLVKRPEVTLTAVLLNEGWLSREL